jgi:hypothetical protein
MKALKITKKQAHILNWVFSAVYLLLAFQADWRIGLALIAYDISCAFEDLSNPRNFWTGNKIEEEVSKELEAMSLSPLEKLNSFVSGFKGKRRF